MARETSRSRHFCHIVPSHHIIAINRSKKPKRASDSNSKLMDICCQVLSPQRGVPGGSLSFSISLFCLLSRRLPLSFRQFVLSLHRGIISALLSGRGFEGVQLNESMSEEGGYFRECHFPPTPAVGIFPRSPFALSHQQDSRTPMQILDQLAVASR